MRRVLLTLLLFAFAMLCVGPSAAQPSVAQLRVANFSPDAPVLEVWLNGAPSGIQTLPANEISGWVQVPAGRHQIAFVPAGGSVTNALVGPFNLELTAGSWSTVPVLGLNGAGSIYAIWLSEDYPRPIPAGYARLTVFNGIPGGAAVDLLASDGSALAQSIRFGRAANVDLPAGPHRLRLMPPGAASGLDTGEVTLEANTYYLLGSVRQRSGGGLVLRSIAQTAVSNLLPAQPAATATFAPTVAMTATAPLTLLTNTPAGTPATVSTMTATSAPTLTPTTPPRATLALTPTPALPPSEWMTLVDMIGSSPQLSITRRALDQVGFTSRVASDRFTLFVPTDDAWRALVDNYPDLLPDVDTIRRVVAYHLIAEPISTADMFDQMTLLTARGAFLRIRKQDGTLTIDGRANVIMADVEALNGVIHVIDAVLVPPDMRPPDMQPVRPLG